LGRATLGATLTQYHLTIHQREITTKRAKVKSISKDFLARFPSEEIWCLLPADFFGAPFLTTINDGHGPDVETGLIVLLRSSSKMGAECRIKGKAEGDIEEI
jgi:hypothetical protein